jgi:hypothetical protein
MVGKNTARGFSLANRPKANIDPAKQGPYNTKMNYPGKEAYTFPHGPSHTSPCMSLYWREKAALREQELKARKISRPENIEHEEKPEEPEEPEDDYD